MKALASTKLRILRELQNWSKLKHKNVLELLGYVYVDGPGGTELALISRWSDSVAYEPSEYSTIVRFQKINDRFSFTLKTNSRYSGLRRDWPIFIAKVLSMAL